MQGFVLVIIIGSFVALVHSYGSVTKHACEGDFLYLDCPRSKRVNLLSANFGRTSKTICPSLNQTFSKAPNCISTKAKEIIYRKCHRKNFCSVKATSAELGGDPCPGISKYIDVIFKCVRIVPYRKITKTQASSTQSTPTVSTTVEELPTTVQELPTTVQELPTTVQELPTTVQELPTTHFIVNISDENNLFNGNSIKPNETNVKASSKDPNDGFFHSMLVLLVLLKDKPKHSLLSVMIGIASGAVMVLITVLICVCVDKKRQKNESACFNDASGEAVEKSELLERNKESNSDSAKTDDQVDSAFCDEELDRRVSNDCETTSDLAYLDQYLDEYNKNRSLPRPPVAENVRRDSGSQRMSRRAHNDGSKGRSYDYNSNNENSFTTFS